jgi:hypothetical protein
MYTTYTFVVYGLIIFGMMLLLFPEQLQSFAPNNKYMQQLIDNRTVIGVASVAGSTYLYFTLPEFKQEPSVSDKITISSPLQSEKSFSSTAPSTSE